MRKILSTSIVLLLVLSALPLFATPGDTVDEATAWYNDCLDRYEQTIDGINEQYGEVPENKKMRKDRDAAIASATKIRDECTQAADQGARDYDDAIREARRHRKTVDKRNNQIWTSPEANPRDHRYNKKKRDQWIRERDAAEAAYEEEMKRAERALKEAKWKKIPPTCEELDEFEEMITRNYDDAVRGTRKNAQKIRAAQKVRDNDIFRLKALREHCSALAAHGDTVSTTTGTGTTIFCSPPPTFTLKLKTKVPTTLTDCKNDLTAADDTIRYKIDAYDNELGTGADKFVKDFEALMDRFAQSLSAASITYGEDVENVFKNPERTAEMTLAGLNAALDTRNNAFTAALDTANELKNTAIKKFVEAHDRA
ncbi:hypothetical protein HY624_02920, partial [Candidatus Uhrbacteria bacterium]|nr:hypothetical protein [Candidatus Uhrbacteria bacterium]